MPAISSLSPLGIDADKEHRDLFERWLTRGDLIAAFENQDLSSADCGRIVFMPVTQDDAAKLVVGETRAPDSKFGLGWRFILKGLAYDLEQLTWI